MKFGFGKTAVWLAVAVIAAAFAAQVVTPVTVTIGGVQTTVEFAGLAPGFVGLYQVNVRLPEGLAGGEAQVVLEIGGRRSHAIPLPIARSR